MDTWLRFSIVLFFCQVLVTGKLTETFEKFYTTDASYMPTASKQYQHTAMGISTLAKFSMLSNTPTLFKVMRPGLQNDANSVSLASIQKDGHYLRYKNYKFHMEKYDGTDLFKKDATFRERLGPRGKAYELLGRDNWFMCHTDATPFTLKARSERIGTQDFVNNCVYVPVKQDMVEKKNIVKNLPGGGAMVVKRVPSTQNTDKCISLRFVNNLGGPVRVVSSLKPEGYLVTANAFKLKTIFKHANHKQRHVIFYAENVQDRDDDVLLNGQNVFTVKPNQCMENFKDVILSSQPSSSENSAKPEAVTTEAKSPPNNDQNNNAPNPPPISDDVQVLPTLPPLNYVPPKSTSQTLNAKPASQYVGILTSQKLNPNTPKPFGLSKTKSFPIYHAAPLEDAKPSSVVDAKPFPQYHAAPQLDLGRNNAPVYQATPKPSASSFPSYQATPKPDGVVATEIGEPSQVSTKQNIVSPWGRANTNQMFQTSYTAPLKQQLQSLDNVLQKRIQTQPFGSVSPVNTPTVSSDGGYSQWSSYGPCSVSCGVGMRRRTRICKPGAYCYGPSAESRPCIKTPCASNCIHTTGGTVRTTSCCHFPFSFNGAQYYHCILSPKNNERMWCATTPSFERDKQWGYCPRSTKAPERSFEHPIGPVIPTRQSLFDGTQSTVSPYNSDFSNTPSEEDTTSQCTPICARVCDPSCPRRCCVSAKDAVPLTAYLGDNYGEYDKRSHVYPYQRRFRRSLFKRRKTT